MATFNDGQVLYASDLNAAINDVESYTYTGPTSNLVSLTLVFSRRGGVTQAVGSLRLDSGWSTGQAKAIIASGGIPSEWRPNGSREGSASLASSTIHRGGNITFSSNGSVAFGMSDTPPTGTDMTFTATWVR